MGGKTINREKFIELANEKHGNLYNYNESIYINKETKIEIKCPMHGYFKQTPEKHLIGQGCPKCRYVKSGQSNRKSMETFIKQANEIHGNKYSYNNVKYYNNKTSIVVTCKIHGDFSITPLNFIHGEQGCPICGKEKSITSRTYNDDDFIIKANNVHNNKYDYSKVKYVNSNEKVIIICPKHGEFKQEPSNHLFGHGCNKCRSSHLERKMRKILIENNIEHIEQYKEKWLGRMSLDFYLPDYNVAIECQGKQHFGVGGWSKEDELVKIKNRDKIKKELCEQNNIEMIYYSDLNIKYPYKVYENVIEIINVLKNK